MPEASGAVIAETETVEPAETPHCRFVPFSPGRRPTDELAHPGLGSSDGAAVITGVDGQTNRAILLFEVGRTNPNMAVDATVRLANIDGSHIGEPLPGWTNRQLVLTPTTNGARQQFELFPETDFPAAQCGFEHGFLRRAVIDLRATWNGTPVAGDQISLDLCDIRNLGSLYQRVIDRIVVPDTARQAAAAAVPNPGSVYHPWNPVLIIGSEKAALYTRGLVGDIVSKEHHLSDPSWLLRVGVYLELLTCIGISEAVRDEFGALLTPEEREQFESGWAYDHIRSRINVAGWKSVWELRKISFPRVGRQTAVSVANLIQKKRATLAFLHVHHEDLKHAIELAGANHHDAQETWQRVFRDAERAVLRKTSEVFPELSYLPGPMRERVLWQQTAFPGQQGLYPTACTQYRASMNHVARRAKQHGLMDYTGDECIPTRVSLLDAIRTRPERVAMLDRADGYGGEGGTSAPGSSSAAVTDNEASIAEFEKLLSAVPILQMLSPDALRSLAAAARPLLIVPDERILIQGDASDSLFLVAEGEVEVLVRRDGVDTPIDRMGRGAVFGEMALLTGEPRNATVRAIDCVMVFEIGTQQYRPLIQAHPEWLDDLAAMMDQRLQHRQVSLARLVRGGRFGRKRRYRMLRDNLSKRFLTNG